MASTASASNRRKQLSHLLDSHIIYINETVEMLEKPASSSLAKVEWSEVVQFGQQIAKQATLAGVLWSGKTPEMKALEENIKAYCNLINGFILTCHGSTVGAGITLHENIRASAKQVVDCSISLLREAISSYETRNSKKGLTIPQLSGSVWEACEALKKTPTTNCTAVGRAITQVAVSIKDVIREMGELKCATSTDLGDKMSNESLISSEDHDQHEFDLGEDLSPAEMAIAQLDINVMTSMLAFIKELIRFITTLLKSCCNSNKDNKEEYTDSLEKLLIYCRDIGSQVSELGACVYPPQEISEMISIAKVLHSRIDQICKEVGGLGGSADGVLGMSKAVDSCLLKLEERLGSDIATQMERLAM